MEKQEIYDFNRARLREAKQLHRWKNRDMAEMIGCEASYVSRVLSSSKDPKIRKHLSTDLAKVWAHKLGLPAGWFDRARAQVSEATLTTDERRLLGTYRALIAAPRNEVREILIQDLTATLRLIETRLIRKKRR